ncbi:MAG: hypothetical protein K8I02_01325, partial [Candidatus Methylomirabilis sp.]|nr:hypothetical protein [Deltaproteobacteria bacterium]
MSCQMIASALSYADGRGVPAARLLAGLEHDEAYLRDPSNWVTWDFYHRLQQKVIDGFGEPEVWRDIGFHSVTSQAFGFVDTLARLFANPKMLYRAVPIYVRFFSRISFVRWISLQDGRGVAEVTIKPGGYMVRSESDYIVGVFSGMPVYLGLPPAESRLEVIGEFGEPGLPPPKPEPVLRLHLQWRTRSPLWERVRNYFQRRKLAEDALRHFETQALELEQRNREVEALNHSLEAKVLQRTKELERALERLQKTNEEKEEFLRAVSHDLCAPLRNIAGMAESLERQWGEALGEKGLDRVGRIRRNSARMTGMIDDLLELSRIKTRRSRKAPTDLASVAREVGER